MTESDYENIWLPHAANGREKEAASARYPVFTGKERNMNNEDINNLELLSMFHYIVGGITALFSCMPLIHVFIGFAMISGKFFNEGKGTEPPALFGWIFVIIGALFIVLGLGMAVCMIVAGIKLKRYKNRVFCMVIAGIECMFIPFGTILGIFTLIVLNKDSVKELFAQSHS